MKNQKSIKKGIKITVLVVVVVSLLYCLTSGRLLFGEKYRDYQKFRKTYAKYYMIKDVLKKSAIGYTESCDALPSGTSEDACVTLLHSLDDPYAEYYNPTQFASFERNFAESYDGIGVVIGDVKFKGESDTKVLIYSTFKGSPAEEAGLKPGDIVVKVDGKKMENSDETCEHVLGVPGTEVKVTIERNGNTKTYTMVRAKIEEKPVSYKKLDKKKKIGYISVSTFKEGTFDAFQLAVKDLKNDGYEKIVIDLRNNGGGMTEESYKMADYLLPEGVIVTEKNKSGHEDTHTSDASEAGIEYVVLVNEQTASASEILSCAIQDNKGGKIIGTTTYGKGVTQITQKLTDGSAIKYTITEYFRPNGKTVNKVGITPDIKIKKVDNDSVIFKAAKEALNGN